MKIAIIDYGMGNIKSISSTLSFLGVKDIALTSDFSVIKRADKIILPGVGSFFLAMRKIRQDKLDLVLHELVINQKKPLLGICLGMQLLGTSSTEDGFTLGLNFVDGKVERFNVSGTSIKIPHVGFNQVMPNKNSVLFSGFEGITDFYFTHSYRMFGDERMGISYCTYGETFVAAFEVRNIAGVQFHPELSQTNGLKLLKNFLEKF